MRAKEINPKIDRNEKVIFIRGLQKAFDEFEVLKGVNLDLYKGENLVVLGRSGTGKSVLIKIISGLLQADEGQVNVLGREVSKLTSKELDALRLKIGFSFQNSALYDSMTVKENLEFPLERHAKDMSVNERNELIDVVLDAVGLSQALNQMPSELSGGQRKRIGIARTLILRPDIMLYDEPTAGLDPITSIEINKLINEVQRRFNTSSIIITHDLTCARAVGDRVVMLLDGHFQRQGTFEEVFAAPDERIQAFYNYNFID
ncbi:ABC transporter ATP-binding protein [Pontibacter cellulosilyticus]|uniref:ATP-binding cassette domain-containing protein n=1 Tax=Pontibacter cellulosilyticus TaxID=1720253 RepID=A0A923N9Y5_9BACT|nr:ATP-binding cassette domain-containing protein [Pontibacter cellulosilyticus]MBC5994394.1 ATP-binding cassette domain-containing protein [Pontibacter cellulosilyticus]